MHVVGPLEVFSRTSRWLKDNGKRDSDAYSLEILGLKRGVFRASSGLRLFADRRFDEVGRGIDTLMIAGGRGAELYRAHPPLLRWIRRSGLPVSTLANVYLLSPVAARAFHQGKIPGVVVTEELLALAERHGASPDRGRAFFVELAAKHVAVARGLGFEGVYLGGHMPASTFGEILDVAGSFAGDDWRQFAREIHYPFADEFYFFEPDPETALSSGEVNTTYLESKRRRKTDLGVPVKYRLSRRLHAVAFEPEAPLFPAARAFYRAVEKAGPVGKIAHLAEQAAKVPLFGCRDCGDCALPEIAYVCPESQCAKNQRNGPCGGTREGLCEVYDSECIWSQAYERLKG